MLSIKKILIFLLCCNFFALFASKKADLVVFSYNRPMQLYALLESIEKYIAGLQEIHVIYRSEEEYKRSYEIVKNRFAKITYHQQGINPAKDFKRLVLQSTFESPSEYILFAVDDIIVKDYVDLSSNIKILEQTKAYGFFLRLGLHLTKCYMRRKEQRVPIISHVEDDIYLWTLRDGEYDWGYPNTVDMTLYKKKQIEQDLRDMNYKAPNSLESQWSYRAHKVANLTGLCHKETKIVNLPLNLVQNECYKNRHMNIFTTKQLLDKFARGLKIDIALLFKIKNNAAHINYEPKFVLR